MQKELNKTALVSALTCEDFSPYYRLADSIRSQTVGDIVHIRALLEFSNNCRRQCSYCGLNCKNTRLPRYRMTEREILNHCTRAAEADYRTVVLQSGEDPWYTPDVLCRIVEQVKKLGVAITLSCGELPYPVLKRLKAAGADRYLLKHETSDPEIYAALHPCGTLGSRVECLRNLKSLGFEVGSGFMIGLPNQTAETIADDLMLLKSIGCDMAGIGPFLPHPETPLKSHPAGSGELTRRAVALARILMPAINLPATTALSVLDPAEKNTVFTGGANVIMQKITPDACRKLYEIYPSPQTHTDIAADRARVVRQIQSLGRTPI